MFEKILTFSVYKTGFATTQQAYEETVYPLFKSLDRLEKILKTKQYLVGDKLTEAGMTQNRYFSYIKTYDCLRRSFDSMLLIVTVSSVISAPFGMTTQLCIVG